MNNENTSLGKLFFLKTATPPAHLMNVKASLTKEGRFPIEECEGISELEAKFRQSGVGVVVICISSRKQLADALIFLSQFKKEVKDRFLIPAVFLQSNDPKEEAHLLKMGCGEVQSYALNERAILHKINRYFKLIQPRNQELESDVTHVNAFKDPSKNLDSASSVAGQATETSENVKAITPGSVEVFPALFGDWDYWLVLKKQHARKIKELWIVEVIGPSPAEGKWERADGGNPLKNEETKWIWKSRRNDGPFYSSYGTWTFFGRRPAFSWTIQRWAFVSSSPDLTFCEDGKIGLDYRFKMKSQSRMSLRKNSDHAISLFPKIKATFDLDYAYKEEEPKDVPWNDRISTLDLKDVNWNFDDLSENESDWNTQITPFSEFEFKLGAEAMEACGLEAAVEDLTANVLGYSEENFVARISFSMPMHARRDHYKISMTAHNLEIPTRFSLNGKTEEWQADPMTGEAIITIVVDEQSKKFIRGMNKAVEKRQEEVFAFFKKVKGVG